MRKHNLAFIDVETTGLNPEKHEIIELGVILVRQIPDDENGIILEEIGEYEYKIKPEHLDQADPESLEINGYDEEKWVFALDLARVMKDFAKKTKGAAFVAHNVIFDHAFVEKAFQKVNVKNQMHYHKIDTLSMAYAKNYHNRNVRSFSLGALCNYYDIKNKNAHSALSDARAMLELYKRLTEKDELDM